MPALVSEQFGDIYFSQDDGLEETRYVFLQHNQLAQRFAQATHFTIMETGFGTGLNFLATWQLFETAAPETAQLHYLSVEKYPLDPEHIRSALAHWPELQPYLDALLAHYPVVIEGFHQLDLSAQVTLTLIIGDANSTLPNIVGSADAWFLDGFAPSKNPDLWSDAVLAEVARLSQPGTTFATFTAASDIRKRLIQHGFNVNKDKGFGRKREMLFGIKQTLSQSNLKPWLERPEIFMDSHLHGNDKVVIIGAGLAGCATAYALKQQGIDSIIIDRGPDIAAGASNNPMGLLSPKLSPDNNLTDQYLTQGFCFTKHIIKNLITAGHQIEHSWCGVLHLAVNDRLQQRFDSIAQRRSLPTEFAQYLDAKTASTIAGLDLPYPGLYLPSAGMVKPYDLCKALLDASEAQFIPNTSIADIVYQKDQWQLLDQDQQAIQTASHVVIANAQSANQFALTQGLPIKSVPGQLSICQGNESLKHLKTALSYEGYCLPAVGGKHLLGATYRNGDPNDLSESRADHQYNLELLNRALNPSTITNTQSMSLPTSASTPSSGSVFMSSSGLTGGSLAQAIAYRTAIRAVTPDHLPIVGPLPNEAQFKTQFSKLKHGERAVRHEKPNYLPGLYINAGHGSKGLASTLLAGEIIAHQIMGKTLPISKAIYQTVHPLRFWVRSLKYHTQAKATI